MKKLLRLKTMLLLCALIAGSGSVWADEEVTTVATFDSNSLVTASTYATTYGGDDWTISIGGNSKSIGFNNKNCTTIGDNLGTDATATNYGVVVKSKKALKGVSKITFIYTGGSGDGGKLYLASSADGTTWSALSLTTGEGLSAQGVTPSQNTTFTFEFDEQDEAYYGFILDSGGTKTAAYRFDNVTVNFLNVVTEADPVLTSIALSGSYATTFFQNDEFSSDGITVTATYDDSSSKDVTANAVFSGYDMSQTGSQTVTVSYTENDVTETATYNITVNERPKFTVTLGDDDTELEEATAGAGVNLPSRSNVADYTFQGWSATNLIEETTTATVIPAGTYKPSANLTLYPAYARSEGSSENKSVTANMGSQGWTNGTKYESLDIDDNITATVTGGSNSGKYYSDGTSWRVYSSESGKLTITAGTGCTLESVTLTFTGKSSSEAATIEHNSSAITSGEAVAVSGTSAEFNVTSGQGRITAISVTYTAGSSIAYYTSNPVTTVDVTISAAKYATYAGARALDFSETGISVYTATDEETKVTLNEIASGKVPANTPVVLYKEGADGTAISVPVIASAEAVGDNDLQVSTGTDVENMYVLAMNPTIGFYPWAGDSDLSAGKVYLQGKASYGARAFIGFDDNETTGIIPTAMQPSTEPYYDLQGRRVAQPSKGLYIVNRRKVVIK